jgi:hypothetical protein
MPNVSKNAAADVVALMQAVLAPQKVHQAIFNIVVTTTPTKARISFSTVLDGVAFVTLSLFETGGQIAGAFVQPFAPSNYSTSFTGLPQNTKLEFRIDVTDPRPPGEQLPGGIVSTHSFMDTGNRTASVHLHSLKEIQGEADITFVTRLYDFDGVEGDAISAILQYGRGHMDPAGNPILDPFGPPLFFSEAPDEIAIYTLADVQTPNVFPGLGFSGLNLPDKFPNDAPNHQIGDGYNDTTAQTIVSLPDAEGPFQRQFSYMSGLFDYVFVVEGFIEGEVTPITATAQQASSGGSHRRLSLSPKDLSISVALPASPIAIVSCGDALRTFQLMVDGGVARLRAGARRQTDLERLSEISSPRGLSRRGGLTETPICWPSPRTPRSIMRAPTRNARSPGGTSGSSSRPSLRPSERQADPCTCSASMSAGRCAMRRFPMRRRRRAGNVWRMGIPPACPVPATAQARRICSRGAANRWCALASNSATAPSSRRTSRRRPRRSPGRPWSASSATGGSRSSAATSGTFSGSRRGTAVAGRRAGAASERSMISSRAPRRRPGNGPLARPAALPRPGRLPVGRDARAAGRARKWACTCHVRIGSWRDERDPSKAGLHCFSKRNLFSLLNASGWCQQPTYALQQTAILVSITSVAGQAAVEYSYEPRNFEVHATGLQPDSRRATRFLGRSGNPSASPSDVHP